MVGFFDSKKEKYVSICEFVNYNSVSGTTEGSISWNINIGGESDSRVCVCEFRVQKMVLNNTAN